MLDARWCPTTRRSPSSDALLEDYGDEWLTQGHVPLPLGLSGGRRQGGQRAAALARAWERRPTSTRRWARRSPSARSAGSGSSARTRPTGPVIEASYRRFLRLLDAHLQVHPFFLGARPASSDFAAYGQLTQLVGFDPTPMAVTLEESARAVAWGGHPRGTSPASSRRKTAGSRATRCPTRSVRCSPRSGRVYVPFLLANAAALASGAERVECEIDGKPWVQQPFPYQGKCLQWLREQHAGLAGRGSRRRRRHPGRHRLRGALLMGRLEGKRVVVTGAASGSAAPVPGGSPRRARWWWRPTSPRTGSRRRSTRSRAQAAARWPSPPTPATKRPWPSWWSDGRRARRPRGVPCQRRGLGWLRPAPRAHRGRLAARAARQPAGSVLGDQARGARHAGRRWRRDRVHGLGGRPALGCRRLALQRLQGGRDQPGADCGEPAHGDRRAGQCHLPGADRDGHGPGPSSREPGPPGRATASASSTRRSATASRSRSRTWPPS